MKIIIVDDDELFGKKVKEKIADENQAYGYETIIYKSALEFCCKLDMHQKADIYILDIKIGNQNGLDLAERIRAEDECAYIIFLTSYEEYAVQGYKYQAYRYIVKQNWQKELLETLCNIFKRVQEREERIYRIQSDRRYDIIYIDDILYLEKDGKNVLFHCKGGLVYTERVTIAEVYNRLPVDEFVYINRGMVVNIRYITHIDSGTVDINESEIFSISRRQLGNIRKKLFLYWRK